MNNEDTKEIDLLGKAGDSLEKFLIANNWDNGGVIIPYSKIWAKLIFPNRINGATARVVEDLMPFAGSHYTTLIRIYHASTKYREIISLCDSFKSGDHLAEKILKLHDLCSGFWEHMGSAIDNIGQCFQCYPNAKKIKNGKDFVCEKSKILDRIYDRRTQFIHSRIVPKGLLYKEPVFDTAFFDGKVTDWKNREGDYEFVSEYYSKDWEEFKKEMFKIWYVLDAHLLDKKNDIFETMARVGLNEKAPLWVQADVPEEYQISNITMVGPSGLNWVDLVRQKQEQVGPDGSGIGSGID